MTFQDLEIFSYFRFANSNTRIYKKISELECERFLKSYPVFEDIKVISATGEEQEDYEKEEKESAYYLINKKEI